MATLTFTRQKLPTGWLRKLHIFVDKDIVLSLKNGETASVEVADGPVRLRCGMALGRVSDVYLVDFTDIPAAAVTAWANPRFPLLDFFGPDGKPLHVEREGEPRLPDFIY